MSSEKRRLPRRMLSQDAEGHGVVRSPQPEHQALGLTEMAIDVPKIGIWRYSSLKNFKHVQDLFRT